MNREELLSLLPKFQHKYEKVKQWQRVDDIRKLILDAHEEFAPLYDKIATEFMGNSDKATFENLFNFLKGNIAYVEEGVRRQYVRSPVAILEHGISDCKGYASFIGGVLDALKRLGGSFDWRYVFAGYGDTNHVFVEADANGKEYWIDPVLKNFNQRTPEPLTIRKFERDMALYKVSGVGCAKCAGGKMGIISQQVESCMLPYESIDQQVMRLTTCSSGGGGGISVPFDTNPDVYDLPINDNTPINAPIDALPMDPGEPVTMNPAPAPPPAGGNGGGTPAQEKSGFPWWILLVAGGMYAMSKKGR